MAGITTITIKAMASSFGKFRTCEALAEQKLRLRAAILPLKPCHYAQASSPRLECVLEDKRLQVISDLYSTGGSPRWKQDELFFPYLVSVLIWPLPAVARAVARRPDVNTCEQRFCVHVRDSCTSLAPRHLCMKDDPRAVGFRLADKPFISRSPHTRVLPFRRFRKQYPLLHVFTGRSCRMMGLDAMDRGLAADVHFCDRATRDSRQVQTAKRTLSSTHDCSMRPCPDMRIYVYD